MHDQDWVKTPLTFSLKSVRFEWIDEVWVPMAADMQCIWGSLQETRWHQRRTDMVLDPGLTGVFVLDDIPEGTLILMHREDGAIAGL